MRQFSSFLRRRMWIPAIGVVIAAGLAIKQWSAPTETLAACTLDVAINSACLCSGVKRTTGACCSIDVGSVWSTENSCTTHDLHVTVSGTGTGTISSTQDTMTWVGGSSWWAGTYIVGTSVVFTAAPGVDSEFAGWGGSCAGAGTNSTCTLTITGGTAHATATFNSTLPPAENTPQELYAAAQAACEGMAMRGTGVIHYYCDCQTGAQGGCVAGDDARANAGNNALDCTTAATPCRTFSAARTTFNRMPAGDTIAFCRGGAMEQSGSLVWNNGNCSAAVDMRAAANTTTCDVREYTAGWGGTNKPILRQLTAAADLFRFWSSTHGVRIMNLDLEGGGGGPCGAVVGRAGIEAGATGDLLACGNTINRMQIGANVNADDNVSNWDFYGNTFTMNSLDAILGSRTNFTIEANLMEDNGSCSGASHVIYPAGSNASQMEHTNYRIINNWIRFVNATCSGLVINGHGTFDGVLIENNFLDAGATSTGGCWGFGIDPDSGYNNVVQYERNMVFRGNRLESAGWHLIHCASCPGVIVENNILVSSGAGANAPLISIPMLAARVIQPDPITENAVIRNNTIYMDTAAFAISVPNPDVSEGNEYIIANNTVYGGGSGTCFNTPMAAGAYTFVGNNACYNATWGTTYDATTHITTDPLFTNVAGGDFTLQALSPLQGAGTATYAAPHDFTGADRANPPSIGAYE